MDAQGSVCAICKGPAEVIDHDHVTGHVRGILCFHCNTGLGHFGDDLNRIETAADYIRRNQA